MYDINIDVKRDIYIYIYIYGMLRVCMSSVLYGCGNS